MYDYQDRTDDILQINEVLPGIFLSGQPINSDDLKAKGIKAVLKLSLQPITYDTTDIEVVEIPWSEYVHQPLDTTVADKTIEEMTRLHQQIKPTLVHCWYGVDRSPNFVYLFLRAMGFHKEAVVDHIKRVRPIVRIVNTNMLPTNIYEQKIEEWFCKYWL